jgi:hypothetical protein
MKLSEIALTGLLALSPSFLVSAIPAEVAGNFSASIHAGDATSFIPIGSPNKGFTTRYWDCCKPSYAWPGKIPGGSMVKQCAKDGVSLLPDNNAKSGCKAGGTAYECVNHRPKVISPSLAYGFAASNEPQLGCGCYKLDFTGEAKLGPGGGKTEGLKGKTMVVQIVNTGGIKSNQFDLLIPGGGVGDFNACSDQYGAPANGWGERYGGIENAAGCDGIKNPEMKEGCLFRFGNWFGGASNPDVQFVRVKCPSWHTDTTGCKRSDE